MPSVCVNIMIMKLKEKVKFKSGYICPHCGEITLIDHYTLNRKVVQLLCGCFAKFTDLIYKKNTEK